MKIKINLNLLNQISIIYLSVPLFIFLLTWLNSYIAIFCSCCLVVAIYTADFKETKTNLSLINNKKIFLIVLGFSLILCYFAGLGGLWYQSNDHHWRNAIFRDLINYDWPVYYKTMDYAMAYYTGHWLLSALFAKIFLFVSKDFAFFIGNIFLLLYSVLGVFLALFHFICAIKVKNYFKVILVVVIFILFSGMDIVGVIFPVFYDSRVTLKDLHLEMWSIFVANFRAFTSQLFWCYNQTIPALILTLLLYNNRKKIENYALIAILCLFSAPIPFLGLLMFFVLFFLEYIWIQYKRNNIEKCIKKIFSIQNIISVLCIAPIISLYFISNFSITSDEGHLRFVFYVDIHYIIMYLYYIILEIGIYYILIYKEYKRNSIYYISLIFLLICPFLKLGLYFDFCMDASMPPLLMLCMMITMFLMRKYNFKMYKFRYIILCLCLLIGSVTPFFEFVRGFKEVVEHKTIFRVADDLKTLEGNVGYNQNGEFINGNFVTGHPKGKIFFKYLARK